MFCRPSRGSSSGSFLQTYRRSSGSSISRRLQADTQTRRQTAEVACKIRSYEQGLCACRCFIGKHEIAAAEASCYSGPACLAEVARQLLGAGFFSRDELCTDCCRHPGCPACEPCMHHAARGSVCVVVQALAVVLILQQQQRAGGSAPGAGGCDTM